MISPQKIMRWAFLTQNSQCCQWHWAHVDGKWAQKGVNMFDIRRAYKLIVLTSVSDHFPPYVQFLALPGGQSGLIWLKFLNLVKISEIWSKFSEVLILFCFKIFYLKIFHLKILYWIRRQCVDCRNRNVDSDSRLFKKSTVTVACRLSTFLWPQQNGQKTQNYQNSKSKQ